MASKANAEEWRAYQRDWRRKDRKANPERERAAKRGYYVRNRATVLGRVADYQRANAEVISMRKKVRYHSQTPEAKRRAALARYGLTLETYAELLAKQGGVCAICLGTDGRKPLDVDHDHKTNKVRGLLCHRCNKGLGLLRDNPALLCAGADYLR